MTTEELRRRRLDVLEEHFRSEVDQEFDRTLATFNGRPHYEIMATGQTYDGDEEVLTYHRRQRTAFPDQRHENVRFHFADDAVVAEFDLLGTNLGEFYGMTPTAEIVPGAGRCGVLLRRRSHCQRACTSIAPVSSLK